VHSPGACAHLEDTPAAIASLGPPQWTARTCSRWTRREHPHIAHGLPDPHEDPEARLTEQLVSSGRGNRSRRDQSPAIRSEQGRADVKPVRTHGGRRATPTTSASAALAIAQQQSSGPMRAGDQLNGMHWPPGAGVRDRRWLQRSSILAALLVRTGSAHLEIVACATNVPRKPTAQVAGTSDLSTLFRAVPKSKVDDLQDLINHWTDRNNPHHLTGSLWPRLRRQSLPQRFHRPGSREPQRLASGSTRPPLQAIRQYPQPDSNRRSPA
jgi:hypothetical protein